MFALWCMTTLYSIVSDLEAYNDGRRMGPDLLDVYQVRLEGVYRELVGLQLFKES